MYKTNNYELYFAMNKEGSFLFNTGDYSKNKLAWAKIGHLRAAFKKNRINEEEYEIYRIKIENGETILERVN